MKKLLFIAVALLCLVACNQNEPESKDYINVAGKTFYEDGYEKMIPGIVTSITFEAKEGATSGNVLWLLQNRSLYYGKYTQKDDVITMEFTEKGKYHAVVVQDLVLFRGTLYYEGPYITPQQP